MKQYVVCIKDVKSPSLSGNQLPFNKFTQTLTKGKYYEVFGNSNVKDILYLIINDIGKKIWLGENEVITLNKLREFKLN